MLIELSLCARRRLVKLAFRIERLWSVRKRADDAHHATPIDVAGQQHHLGIKRGVVTIRRFFVDLSGRSDKEVAVAKGTRWTETAS